MRRLCGYWLANPSILIASYLIYIDPHRLRLLLALLRAGFDGAQARAADLDRSLGAVGLRRVLLDSLTTGLADPPRPLCAPLLSGVALSDILALLLLDGLTLNDVVLDVVLVISQIGGCTN